MIFLFFKDYKKIWDKHSKYAFMAFTPWVVVIFLYVEQGDVMLCVRERAVRGKESVNIILN